MQLEEVVALVLTHRRPRLATDVVKGLIDLEGFAPRNIFLIVNGEGGLVDAALERSIQVVRLTENLGPAGGYREGLRRVAAETTASWIYLCEDDVGLFDIPTPRVRTIIEAVKRHPDSDRIGAVVAYGRDLDRRRGFASVHQVTQCGFENVDVAPWGATLVARSVLDAGILPDPAWFFGFEDFDFWLQVQEAGFSILVDGDAARSVTMRASGAGRDTSFVGERPTDTEEAWRSYYLSRNFMELRRRWGTPTWTLWHLLKSARRLQLAPTSEHRRALLLGLRDGFLKRLGKNPRFQRSEGEF